MKQILHVTDAFNGGVFELILELVREYPENEYIVLFRSHSWDPKSGNEQFSAENVMLIEWKKNIFAKYIQLFFLVRKFKPTFVHLHSTVAGLIGRLLPRSKEYVLYSPHAFAFQKLDFANWKRKIIYAIEMVLQFRTQYNVAFWPIEKELFEKFKSQTPTIYTPIIIEKYLYKIPDSRMLNIESLAETPFTVASVGRLAPQKDPFFFMQVVKQLEKLTKLEAHWFGDGTKFSADLLSDQGIKVRGWIQPNEIFLELAERNSICVFTSAWESGPITLFESLAFGIPVVCRSIEAFDYYGLSDGTTPEEIALRIFNIINEGELMELAAAQREMIIKELPPSGTIDFAKLVK